MLEDHSLKIKKGYKNLKKQEINDIYQNELDKICFQHDMVYEDFKHLPRRTTFGKLLHDRAFDITKNLKYDGYQRTFVLKGVQKKFGLTGSLFRKRKYI